MKTLIKGETYETENLVHTGWTQGDGSGYVGYHMMDYFDDSGVYRGPDECGIEPTFE